jgi:hypothetical protein
MGSEYILLILFSEKIPDLLLNKKQLKLEKNKFRLGISRILGKKIDEDLIKL